MSGDRVRRPGRGGRPVWEAWVLEAFSPLLLLTDPRGWRAMAGWDHRERGYYRGVFAADVIVQIQKTSSGEVLCERFR